MRRGDPVIQEVDMATFVAAQRDGAVVVDVREPDEYRSAHVPGAVLMPLASVPTRVHELPRDRAVYVICQSGARSARAADYLSARGVDARSVRGGTGAWAAAGNPTAVGNPTVAGSRV
jgi:rhodanese-related sulfurtransferase